MMTPVPPLADQDLIVDFITPETNKLAALEEKCQRAIVVLQELLALGDFSAAFIDTILGGLDNYQSMAEQVLTNDKTRKGFERMVLEMVYKEFQRKQGDSGIAP